MQIWNLRLLIIGFGRSLGEMQTKIIHGLQGTPMVMEVFDVVQNLPGRFTRTRR